jgi:hypothetical protein
MLMKLSECSVYRDANQPTHRTIVSTGLRTSERHWWWDRSEMAAAQKQDPSGDVTVAGVHAFPQQKSAASTSDDDRRDQALG